MIELIAFKNFMCGRMKYLQSGLDQYESPWRVCLDVPGLSPLNSEKIDDLLIECFQDVTEIRGKYLKESSLLIEIVQSIKIPDRKFKKIPRKANIVQEYYMGETEGECNDSTDFHNAIEGLLLFSRIKSTPYSIHTHSSSTRGSMVCLLSSNQLGIFNVSGYNGAVGTRKDLHLNMINFLLYYVGFLK